LHFVCTSFSASILLFEKSSEAESFAQAFLLSFAFGLEILKTPLFSKEGISLEIESLLTVETANPFGTSAPHLEQNTSGQGTRPSSP
jgi:hypothetical protein